MQLSGRSSRKAQIAGVILVLLALLIAAIAPARALAKTGPSNIAVGQIGQLPTGALIFRFLDLTIPEGQPPVEHSLGAGFIYVVDGMHLLVEGNEQQLIAPSEGIWIGARQLPMHAASAGSASHLWFIEVAPAVDRGTPPAWPYSYPNASIFAESPDFQATGSGPYSLVLTDVLLESPGDAADPLGQVGPAAVVVVNGQVSIGQQKFPPKVLLQSPGDSRPFFNRGTGPARLLAVRLVPAGMPLDLVPSTLPGGGEAGGRAPLAWLLLASGLGLVTAGRVVGRRTAH